MVVSGRRLGYRLFCHLEIVYNACHSQPLVPSSPCLPGVLEDGLSSNGVLRSAVPEKKMTCGTQCPNSQSLSSGPLTQKQNGLWTTEVELQPQNQLGTGEWVEFT